jgi:hypothetical protein
MNEIKEMIEKLKAEGYRVLPPKTKEKKEFKPFKAIHLSCWGYPSVVEVIGETPKFFKIQSGYVEAKIRKEEIFEYDENLLKEFQNEINKAKELEDNARRIRENALDNLRQKLKPIKLS